MRQNHVIIGALILINFFLFGLGPASIGKMAPDFKLKEIRTGKDISLNDYRGKIVILDFWASWCLPSKESLPELAQLDSQNPSLKVLAITVDNKKKHATNFLDNNDLKLTILHDKNHTVAGAYEIPAIPTAIIVDQEGFIRHLHIGYTKTDLDQIRKEIKKIQ
jgi:peroxiredoxin